MPYAQSLVFLVIWSICLCYSVVRFKNGPESVRYPYKPTQEVRRIIDFYSFTYFFDAVSGDKDYENIENIFRTRRRDVTIFNNPSVRAGYDTRSIFKRSLTGLTSEFFILFASCFTKAEEPSLSYCLPIAGGRIIGFIPFPRVLVLCEMQSVSSRI